MRWDHQLWIIDGFFVCVLFHSLRSIDSWSFELNMMMWCHKCAYSVIQSNKLPFPNRTKSQQNSTIQNDLTAFFESHNLFLFVYTESNCILYSDSMYIAIHNGAQLFSNQFIDYTDIDTHTHKMTNCIKYHHTLCANQHQINRQTLIS